MRVKISLAQKAEDWRQKYYALEQRHIRTELELQSVEAQLQELIKRHEKLFAQLSIPDHSNVTPIKSISANR